ncbi:MAG TPA: ABC transporter ATP-binding protein [Reyranella sp.]|nr:ABC transporter ATP-binding protein [Reyranella sp.]
MLLEVDRLDVKVRLASGDVAVLRDVSFDLQPGRILGLVGESGAGKSMIGRVVAGLLPEGFKSTAQRFRFDGKDLLDLPAEQRRRLLGDRIAFIPQEPLSALNPVLTIGRQFIEHLARLGVPRGERRRRATDALTEVLLPEPDALLDRYPFQLSGGMCQRVLIAMAFASNPSLVVADEPTTALDVTTQVHIVSLIRRLQAAHGTGLLFITHDLRLAAHLCDEIAVLYAGDVVERGPAKQVFGAPRHPYTRALKQAMPGLTGDRRPLQALPDIMPGIEALGRLPGCRFAARCPTADASCAASLPPLALVAPGHWVRCASACTSEVTAPSTIASEASGPANGKALLKLDGIAKSYIRGRITAVKDASFSIASGESVGIVGESGSGKSTLARLVMGLDTPSAGYIELDGIDVTVPEPSWEKRISLVQMIFQDPASALNPRRRVANLVTQSLEARSRAASEAERLKRALELLGDTGLPEGLLQRFPPQLSGGQRQRVNIARALCAEPRLLVADEIVSGLDVSVQAQILNLLQKLRREHGVALLFISHDLSVVRHLCERVLVMKGGEIVESGRTEEVFSRPRHAYTRELLAAVPPDDMNKPWPPTP